MEHHDQSNLGGKGFFGLCFHIIVHHQESQDKNLTAQEPGGVRLTGLLLEACSVCFLTAVRTKSPRTVLSTVGWDLLHGLLIKKVPYRLILWRHFLNWHSLLSDSRLYLIDIKLASTELCLSSHQHTGLMEIDYPPSPLPITDWPSEPTK